MNKSIRHAGRYPVKIWGRSVLPTLICALVGTTLTAFGEEYMFTTLAGSGGPGAVDGPAASARFNNPLGLSLDRSGNIYVADGLNATIRKIAPDGAVSTMAGLAASLGTNNGAGSAARFNFPAATCVDQAGNVYLADQFNHAIRRITPDGLVTTFAGNPGTAGSVDGLGTAARFSYPAGLVIDLATNLYVVDTGNHTIRKITAAGEVTTYAGKTGQSGSSDGPRDQALFSFPSGLALAADGVLYVADSDNNTIRKISANGLVATLAGAPGQSGSSDGAGADARFSNPTGLALDRSGLLYVADNSNSTIRKVTPDGAVTTLAGDPTPPDLSARPFVSYADGVGSNARFKYPNSVVVDSNGIIYVADTGNDAIRRITANGLVTTLAGSSRPGTNDGPGITARFNHPTGVAVDSAGTVYVVDGLNNTIRQISTNRVVTTIAGEPGVAGANDGSGGVAHFDGPRKLGINSSNQLFVADTGNDTVRRVLRSGGSSSWEVSTFAGSAGNSGSDDGTGSAARFNSLYDVAPDAFGNLYVADKDNQVIRKITAAGIVTTFAGQVGTAGSADGLGTAAQFNFPYGLAVGPDNCVYVADTVNSTIRKISPDRLVATLAGRAGVLGSTDGPGSQSLFNFPFGVAVDAATNVYVADYGNNLIRRVDPVGNVVTLGGFIDFGADGQPLNGSADGPGPVARFFNPKGIAVDPRGTVYVADSFNHAIRVGTTNSCPDEPTIDLSTGPVGQLRQLGTSPQTAVSWQWSIIRRPANSRATLSNPTLPNPTFIPDVADLFIFQLQATNSTGAICVRTLSFSATAPALSILSSSLSYQNGSFTFQVQGTPGARLEIQSSQTVTNWSFFGTLTNETGTATVVDPAPDPGRRFYRVRQL